MPVKHALTVALAFLFGGLGGYLLSDRKAVVAAVDRRDVCAPFSCGDDRSTAKTPSDRTARDTNDEDDGDSVEAVEAATFVIGDGVTEVVETAQEENPDMSEAGADPATELTAEDLAEIQRRRAAHREELLKARSRKLAFIDSINTDFLTEEQKTVHSEYAETLAARNAAKDRVRQAVERGVEPSLADRTLIHDCEMKLLAQSSAERKLLLEAAARSVGLEGAAVGDFLEILKSIDSSTSNLKD